jgi:DNA-binding MarR family transcriptional regulator
MPKQNPRIQKITSLLQLMFKLQQDVDSVLTNEAGVGLSAYRMLSVIDSKVPITQRKIAGILGQTEANVSRQIRAMAEDGLVKIAPDKKDKRQRNISRTSKGDTKLAKAEELLEKNSNYLLKQINSK